MQGLLEKEIQWNLSVKDHIRFATRRHPIIDNREGGGIGNACTYIILLW